MEPAGELRAVPGGGWNTVTPVPKTHQVKYPLSGSTPTQDVTFAPNTAEGYTDIDNHGK